MKGRFLSEFEFYVMAAASLLADDAYGVTIRREIETRARRPVAMGAVYATLARLEEKGFVTFSVSEPLPIQGGRSRKYVRVTASGRRALQHSVAMLSRMLPGLAAALESNR